VAHWFLNIFAHIEWNFQELFALILGNDEIPRIDLNQHMLGLYPMKDLWAMGIFSGIH